jgi:predicted nucleic acid-binding protein
VKILFDTNVVLDVLMDREPFSGAAAALFAIVEEGMGIGYLCATTLTTVYYLASKTLGAKSAKHAIRKLLALLEVAAVNRPVLETALQARFNDFEDAVVYAAALHVGVDVIVTRNRNDFKTSKIPVYSPLEAEKILSFLKEE